ncbi:class I SAM-dependent RNA methyltransferase [Tsukamurella soli]|uniref:class I SAM-dependent RNA methyltransferase n=1 Tax=Tsukamurella soli TaxID=644556 RepID=UPI0036180E18
MIAGEALDVTVGAPAHGGFVIGRVDGRVVFVSGALPGETVRATVTEVKSSFARAVTVDVLDPSPQRVPQACAAAAAGAGCCDLTHAEPAYARRLKSDVLADALRRIGRFAEPPGGFDGTVAEVTDGLVAGWRHRTRLALSDDGRLGWHAARSATVIPSLDCRQLPAALIAGLPARVDASGGLHEVVVALDDAGTRHAVLAVGSKQGGWAAEQVLDGSGIARQHAGGHDYEMPVTAFWQAHRDAVARYSELIARWVPDGSGHAWDLYGGAGVFGAVLAERGTRVDVVETAADAVRAGRKALRGTPVTFHRRPVDKVVASLQRPDAVILDPPRAGAGAR